MSRFDPIVSHIRGMTRSAVVLMNSMRIALAAGMLEYLRAGRSELN